MVKDQKITTHSWECSRCPKCPGLEYDEFRVVKTCISHLAFAGVSGGKKSADVALSPNALMVKRQ